MSELYDFVAESNRIEGITRAPAAIELTAHEQFLETPKLTIVGLKNFVAAIQPSARLRDKAGLDVRVGQYFPPAGCIGIRVALQKLLDEINAGNHSAYSAHLAYEHLHPFTDGNGRSGRAIWLWQMKGRAPLGFLHHWYYSSLSSER